MNEALDVGDPPQVSLGELRAMASRMFRLLEGNFPPSGALERYAAFTDELVERSRRAAQEPTGADAHQGFRDCQFYSRFELYVDGILAAYLKYRLHGGQLRLTGLIEQADFSGLNLGRALMHRTMLNAHHRRLSVVPDCAAARIFFAQNPQYALLIPARP